MFEASLTGTARLELIGREREKAVIDKALRQHGKLQVVYLRGSGGIGKSALLQHLANFFNTQPRPDFLYSGVIDLYDHDSYSSVGLEKIILNGLKSDLEKQRTNLTTFPGGRSPSSVEPLLTLLNDYQRRSDELREKQLALPSQGSLVENLRQALAQQFLRTYRALEQNYRVVLCFDTIELLEHQIDNAQLKLGLVHENILGRNWLCQTIAQMRNSVVVLAGRPETGLDEDLRMEAALRNAINAQYPGQVDEILSVVSLHGLTAEEVSDYLYRARPEFYEGAEELDPNSLYMENVTLLTGGKPIMLGWFAELCGQKPWIDIGTKSPAEIPALITLFEQAIVADIQRGRGLDLSEWEARSIIEYMVLARKGLRADMLAFLLQRTNRNSDKIYTPELCQEYLEKLRSLSFIKVREARQLFFLHDEIYRILSSRPETRTNRQIYQLLVEYEKAQLDDLNAAMAEIEQASEWYYDPLLLERYLELERQIQVRVLERMHYHICADVRAGYDEYCRQADICLLNSQFEQDERLRDEFLRLMADGGGWRQHILAEQGMSSGLVERDEALRWLKRLWYRGRSAPEWLVTILQQFQNKTATFEGLDDPLFQAGTLLMLWNISILETRGSPEMIERLETMVTTLKTWPGQEALNYPPLGSYHRTNYTAWLYDSQMGYLLNNLGYTYRLQRRLLRAEQCYREALPYLKRAGRVENQLADTMNALAFVHRLQGRLVESTILCQDALRQREREGHSYNIALSRNTLGLIYLSLERYEAAERECLTARRLMERAVGRSDNRGIGLVFIALGQILRHKGQQLLDMNVLNESIDYLHRSADLFDMLGEPVRQVEAYNELGCAYRGLGIVRSQRGDKAVSEVYQRALQYLEYAITLCGSELMLERADCYQDMAEVCFQQNDDERSFYYLELADQAIDPIYYYQQNRLPDWGDDGTPECLTCLGKNEMLRGDLYFRRYFQAQNASELERAIEFYVRAVGYFERFTTQTELTNAALAKLYFRLSEQIRQPTQLTRTQQDRVNIARFLNYYRDNYNLQSSPTLRQLLRLLGD